MSSVTTTRTIAAPRALLSSSGIVGLPQRSLAALQSKESRRNASLGADEDEDDDGSTGGSVSSGGDAAAAVALLKANVQLLRKKGSKPGEGGGGGGGRRRGCSNINNKKGSAAEMSTNEGCRRRDNKAGASGDDYDGDGVLLPTALDELVPWLDCGQLHRSDGLAMCPGGREWSTGEGCFNYCHDSPLCSVSARDEDLREHLKAMAG